MKESDRVYFRERNDLALRIREHFEAVKKPKSHYQVPGPAECEIVAGHLLIIQDINKAKAWVLPDHDRVVTQGRAFLAELANIKPKLAREAEHWGIQDYATAVDAIDDVSRSIAALLVSPLINRGRRDPIRIIAKLAQKAWARVNEGRFPRSFEPKQPVCLFVHRALAEIGLKMLPTGISDVLRGKRRKPK
jgi:hypothetical protein